MLANWIHIVIVHVTVLGTPWLAYRTIIQRKLPLNSTSWKFNYSATILLGIVAAIAYFTGPESSDYIKQVLTDFPQDHVEDHAFWGRVGFVIQVIAGLVGIMGWASILQEEAPDRRTTVVLITLLIINTLILLYTAHLGGYIRRMDLM
ncbi:MAG TPA: hypothetical protein DDX92_07480 [Flavobacteriales bacterium]|jgi:uncharacterized membrane protein|nr:hypothetical protein [Flavobacteriales bacterium]